MILINQQKKYTAYFMEKNDRNLQNKDFKQTFTYKQLTFNTKLDFQLLVDLEKRKGITSKMVNQSQVNLSGRYWKNWRYNGRAISNTQEVVQKQQSFVNLLKKVQWESLLLMFQRKAHTEKTNILKQLSLIQFPKLTKLVLIGDNISSVELFQTINLPCLEQLNLDFNKITNLRSFSKINSKEIKIIDLSMNFLNSQTTFQCLTKLNSPKLQAAWIFQADIKYQIRFLRDIQRYINGNNQNNLIQEHNENNQIQECLQQKGKYDEEIEFNTRRELTCNILPKNQSFYSEQVQRLYNDSTKKSIQILDYLLHWTLETQHYKYLLKSNSQTQKILCPNEQMNTYLTKNTNKYSPYQFFVDFSTDIDKFLSLYQIYLDKKTQYYQTAQYLGCPCCQGRCFVCGQYDNQCVCKEQNYDVENPIHEKRGFYFH